MFATVKKLGPHHRENHGMKLEYKLDLPLPPCLLTEKNENGKGTSSTSVPKLPLPVINPGFRLNLPIPPCLLEPKTENQDKNQP